MSNAIQKQIVQLEAQLKAALLTDEQKAEYIRVVEAKKYTTRTTVPAREVKGRYTVEEVVAKNRAKFEKENSQKRSLEIKLLKLKLRLAELQGK